jgi:hypothetical protein
VKYWDDIVSDLESYTTSKQASKIRSFGFSSQTAPPSQTLLESLDMLPNNITDPMCSIVASRVRDDLFGSGQFKLRSKLLIFFEPFGSLLLIGERKLS